MLKNIIFLIIIVCASLVFIVISKRERREMESEDDAPNTNESNKKLINKDILTDEQIIKEYEEKNE